MGGAPVTTIEMVVGIISEIIATVSDGCARMAGAPKTVSVTMLLVTALYLFVTNTR